MLLPRRVRVIAEFAAKVDDPRFAMHSVRVERAGEKVVAVATDGFRLIGWTGETPPDGDWPVVAGVPAEDGKPESLTLDGEKLAKVAGAHKDGNRMSILDWVKVGTVEGGGAFAASTDLGVPVVATIPEAEGNFPRWREVIPEPPEGAVTLCLGLRLLIDTLKRLQTLSGRPSYRGVQVKLTSTGEGKAVLIAVEEDDGGQAWAVQMPCGDVRDAQVPVKIER